MANKLLTPQELVNWVFSAVNEIIERDFADESPAEKDRLRSIMLAYAAAMTGAPIRLLT